MCSPRLFIHFQEFSFAQAQTNARKVSIVDNFWNQWTGATFKREREEGEKVVQKNHVNQKIRANNAKKFQNTFYRTGISYFSSHTCVANRIFLSKVEMERNMTILLLFYWENKRKNPPVSIFGAETKREQSSFGELVCKNDT